MSDVRENAADGTLPRVFHRRPVPALALFGLVALGYLIGSRLAFALAEAAGQQAVFFIPAGIVLGALLRSPKRRWPIIAAAAATAEFGSDLAYGLGPIASMGFALANVAGPLAGATVAIVVLRNGRHWSPVWSSLLEADRPPARPGRFEDPEVESKDFELVQPYQVAAFVAGVVGGSVVSATVGASIDQLVMGDPWWETAWQWWLGDSLGALIIGSLVISWRSTTERRSLWSLAGAVLLVAAVGSLLVIVATTRLPLEFLAFAGIVVGGAIFGSRAAAIVASLVAVAFGVSLATGWANGWLGVDDDVMIAVVKGQLGVFTLLGLGLASELHAHSKTIREATRLERRVEVAGELQSVFNSIDEGFCIAEIIVDRAGEAVDYRFVRTNPLFEEMTGLADAEGRTALELVPDLEQYWIDTYARVGLAGQTVRFEQGSEAMGRWFDVFATPLDGDGRLAIVFKDITDRHLAEERIIALLDSERDARYRAQLLGRLASDLAMAATVTDVADVAIEALGELGAVAVNVRVLDQTEGECPRLRSIASAGAPGVGPDGADAGLDALVPTSEAFRSGSVVAVDGCAEALDRFPGLAGLDEQVPMEAILAMPLRSTARERIGALAVIGPESGWFDRDRRELVTAIVDQLGGALDRARLYDLLERERERESEERRRAELVTSILTEVSEVNGLEARTQRLVDLIVAQIADIATIEVPSEDDVLLAMSAIDDDMLDMAERLRHEPRLRPAASSKDRIGVGESRLVSSANPAVERQEATDSDSAELLDRLGLHAFITLPIDLGAGVRGALMMGLVDPQRQSYDADDLRFVEFLADRAGVVLAAAALADRERATSTRLQRALLPDQLARDDRLHVAARYQAATQTLEVGGDWYDTYTWPDGTIGLLVGDVMGHGLEAAASMGRLRSALAALAATLAPDPSAILAALDRVAKGPNGTNFATALCVVIDPVTGACRYASAGHPPALVVHAGGTVTWLDEASSPPLCAITVDRRPEGRFDLAPDDVVVLYSDGLIERRGESIDVGLRRLEQAVGGQRCELVGDFIERLTDELAPKGSLEDDLVVLGAHFAPAATFSTTIEAEPTALAPLRQRLQRWLDLHGVDSADRQRILLGVGEASTNGIEHAYRSVTGGGGTVTVELDYGPAKITARILDGGRWRPAVHRPDRGRGIRIMESVADEHSLTSSPAGTTATLTFATGSSTGSDR